MFTTAFADLRLTLADVRNTVAVLRAAVAEALALERSLERQIEARGCPVVRIMPSSPSQGAFVEINETDFDPAVHSKFETIAAPPRSRASAA